MSEENQPLIGRTIALETRYDVSTQVLSSTLAERLPAMCGSETLATLVSRTSMNVASVTVSAMIQGFTGARSALGIAAVMESVWLILALLFYEDLGFHGHTEPQIVIA